MGNGERVGVSTGADTNKRTLGGGGALEHSDLRFLEDGGECSGALVSDLVATDTASEAAGWNGEKVGMSTGAARKQTLRGRRRT